MGKTVESKASDVEKTPKTEELTDIKDVSMVSKLEDEKIDSLSTLTECKREYKKFIESLPRICSPSLFNSPEVNDVFNWSIDQMAILKPIDIEYDADFNSKLDNTYDSLIEKENERFFKEKEILPSPESSKIQDYITVEDNNNLDCINEEVPNEEEEQEKTPTSNKSSVIHQLTPFVKKKTRQRKKLFFDCDPIIDENAVDGCVVNDETIKIENSTTASQISPMSTSNIDSSLIVEIDQDITLKSMKSLPSISQIDSGNCISSKSFLEEISFLSPIACGSGIIKKRTIINEVSMIDQCDDDVTCNILLDIDSGFDFSKLTSTPQI